MQTQHKVESGLLTTRVCPSPEVYLTFTGMVCHRKDLNPATGCCDNGTKPACNVVDGHECTSEYACCTLFETCVSCCLTVNWDLTPERQIEELRQVSGLAFRYAKPANLFDFCLLRCRTSSASVVHQNTFRSKWKYCYGPKESPILLEEESAYTEVHDHKDPWGCHLFVSQRLLRRCVSRPRLPVKMRWLSQGQHQRVRKRTWSREGHALLLLMRSLILPG